MAELKRLSEAVITRRDHLKGFIDSPVVLLEYGDFECSDSGIVYPTIKRIQKILGDKLCFAFRHYPLVDDHPHALSAAVAAEAAAAQGKFWEMYDILFKNQSALEDKDIFNYAKKIGLNMDLFNRDFTDKVYLGKIRKDMRTGEESGVEETPTFFINGIMYEESYEYEIFLSVLKSVANVK